MLRRTTVGMGVVLFVLTVPVHGAIVELELPAGITRASAESPSPGDIWAGSDTGDIYHFTGFE